MSSTFLSRCKHPSGWHHSGHCHRGSQATMGTSKTFLERTVSSMSTTKGPERELGSISFSLRSFHKNVSEFVRFCRSWTAQIRTHKVCLAELCKVGWNFVIKGTGFLSMVLRWRSPLFFLFILYIFLNTLLRLLL